MPRLHPGWGDRMHQNISVSWFILSHSIHVWSRVYLPTFTMKIDPSCIGKYTSPMDPIWVIIGNCNWTFSSRKSSPALLFGASRCRDAWFVSTTEPHAWPAMIRWMEAQGFRKTRLRLMYTYPWHPVRTQKICWGVQQSPKRIAPLGPLPFSGGEPGSLKLLIYPLNYRNVGKTWAIHWVSAICKW